MIGQREGSKLPDPQRSNDLYVTVQGNVGLPL